MKYSCIIVDDEPLARKGIELHCKEMDTLHVLEQFGNAVQAGKFLKDNEVDILFLDIQMPGLTGIDFLKSLHKSPAVIFTTAYPNYALEAFELDVIDYLLKPIRFERFFKAVNKAQDYIYLTKKGSLELADFTEEYIFIKANRKYVKLYYKDILYIQGMKDYVMIFTPDSKYMTAMNIKTILNQLPSKIFFRVSKSYIININKIDSLDSDVIYIQDNEVPLGSTYKEDFLNLVIKGKLLRR